MGYIDPVIIASIGALIVGVPLIVTGFYTRRRGRLRNRQGAAVLAGFAAFMGFIVMSMGALSLVRVALV